MQNQVLSFGARLYLLALGVFFGFLGVKYNKEIEKDEHSHGDFIMEQFNECLKFGLWLRVALIIFIIIKIFGWLGSL